MDFKTPSEITKKLAELDDFIEAEIKPLESEHTQFFDHRREYARTDWENGGRPRREWEELLAEMKRRADHAGHLRYALPKEVGGSGGSNLAMAFIREHLASKALGLHNDLQSESSIVGNFVRVHMMLKFGTQAQKDEYVEAIITGRHRIGMGITEPNHGSDATWLESTAVRQGGDWVLNGVKRFNSGMNNATADIVLARTSGTPGEAKGITAFIVPANAPGFTVERMLWTFNMPTDHAEVVLTNVRVPNSAILHQEGEGLACAQHFVHEARIRQAAASLGAAQFCIDESVAYARTRKTWGKPLAVNQAIQFPLVDLHCEAELVRNLVHKTAWHIDRKDYLSVTDWVSMANYRANRLACNAADTAMQIHGGIGYTREKPFEHIYRHHRRYRITEGSDEIQMRRIAGKLFGFTDPVKHPI